MILKYARNFVVVAAVVILTACAGYAPSNSTVAPVGNAARHDSSAGALLYVSDSGASTVNIYNYPADTAAGTLAGLTGPWGECVDRSGDVYVVLDGARQVVEYAHGATSPMATFKIPREDNADFSPAACAVDPTTGNLAVTDVAYGTSQNLFPGDVRVFSRGQKKAERFHAKGFYSYYYLAYDNDGNLFVDGTSGRPGIGGTFEYAELPVGQKKMQPIGLTGATIATPGNVQWDGTHITVGDSSNAVIYQTNGAKIIGSTPLTGSSHIEGYLIDGKTVICPDAGNKNVEFYNYPAGGEPTKVITGFDQPFGAAVSK